MKNLPAKYVLSIIAACLLGAFSVAPLSGCATLSKIEGDLTGSNAVLTLQVAGDTANFAMHTANQMLIRGQITQAQWQVVATLFDKQFLPAYNLAVKNVVAANAPSTASIQAVMSQLVSTVDGYIAKTP